MDSQRSFYEDLRDILLTFVLHNVYENLMHRDELYMILMQA